MKVGHDTSITTSNHHHHHHTPKRVGTKSEAVIKKSEFRLIKSVLDKKKINMGILNSKENAINSLKMEAMKNERKITKGKN